jgi:hypothetical protein
MVCCFGLVHFSQAQQLQVKLSPQLKQGAYHISCAGQSNGAIQSLVIGGKSPYTYQWNDNTTSANRTGLAAGTYILTVTDSNLVQAADTVILLEPQALTLSSQISTYPGGFAISQHGQSDGTIQMLVSGGVPPYTYAWNSGGNQAILSSVASGNYSCIVSDAAGCSNSANQSLNAPSQLSATVTIQQHISCYGNSDGAATVIVTGGVGPYKYRWFSSESDSITFSLPGGLQNVDINDKNGAEIRVSFEIIEPEEFLADIQIPIYPNGYEVSCNGCYNGVVTISGIGGTAPYSILWSDSVSAFSRTQLGGGKLAFKLSDSHGCEVRENLKLSEPERDDWSKSGNTGVNPSNQFIGTTDASPIAFKANNQEVMRIAENGNIGIGTNAPEYKFDVDGDVRLKQSLKLTSLPELTTSALSYEQENNFKAIVLGPDGDMYKISSPDVIRPYLSDQLCKVYLDGEMISYWKSLKGNPAIIHAGTSQCRPFVGIGTTTPQANLHVNGDSRTDNKTSARKAVFGNFDTFTEGNFKVSIPAFNMSSESGALEINHTTNHLNNYSFVNKVNQDFTKAIVVKHSTSDQENFIVYGDGTTIIGYDATNPIEPDKQTLLAVMGLIGARGVKVTVGNFPDYVFKEDYELMSLNELEAYLKEHKHLPGVMSETDVEVSKGAELGLLASQSLEKIEELYLYLIDLEKRVNLLEVENTKLHLKLSTTNTK